MKNVLIARFAPMLLLPLLALLVAVYSLGLALWLAAAALVNPFSPETAEGMFDGTMRGLRYLGK